MAQVFISYSKKDGFLAEAVSASLNEAGITNWFDREIQKDEGWRRRIQAELDNCAVVLVIWTGNSILSDFVIDESSRALSRGKLVQALFDSISPPIGFGEQQHHELIGWRGQSNDGRWVQLLKSISRISSGEGARAPEPRSSPTLATSSKAQNAWRAIVESTRLQDYIDFCAKFPESPLTKVASEHISDLRSWEGIDKTDPAQLRRFIINGAYPAIASVARDALPHAEFFAADMEKYRDTSSAKQLETLISHYKPFLVKYGPDALQQLQDKRDKVLVLDYLGKSEGSKCPQSYSGAEYSLDWINGFLRADLTPNLRARAEKMRAELLTTWEGRKYLKEYILKMAAIRPLTSADASKDLNKGHEISYFACAVAGFFVGAWGRAWFSMTGVGWVDATLAAVGLSFIAGSLLAIIARRGFGRPTVRVPDPAGAISGALENLSRDVNKWGGKFDEDQLLKMTLKSRVEYVRDSRQYILSDPTSFFVICSGFVAMTSCSAVFFLATFNVVRALWRFFGA